MLSISREELRTLNFYKSYDDILDDKTHSEINVVHDELTVDTVKYYGNSTILSNEIGKDPDNKPIKLCIKFDWVFDFKWDKAQIGDDNKITTNFFIKNLDDAGIVTFILRRIIQESADLVPNLT